MILSDKIILLRKKNNLTQEELAEKLGVSRQSVSKWEMGNSIPDINKIIQLSDVFGVKTDYLLKNEIDDIEYSDDTVEELEAKKTISVEDANDFMSAYEEYSNNVAESISLFIISPVAVLVSQIIALTTDVKSEDFFVIGGIVVLFLIIAFGVYKLIVKANLIEKYDFISKESFNLSYGVKGLVEKKKEEREQKDNKSIAAAIIMYILCVIPVILVSISENEILQLSSVVLLLIIIRTQHHPTDLPAGLAYFVGRAYLQRALRSFLRQHFSQTILYCTGISTGCPSPTPFGLSLGPDLP